MARWNDREKTRRIGRKRLAEPSAIQHDASRAPSRRARLGTYFSQSDSPHDRPLGGGGGPDAAVAPRARAASRRGGHDGVSLHGGAGNHILCHRGRHRSPRSLRSYPSAPDRLVGFRTKALMRWRKLGARVFARRTRRRALGTESGRGRRRWGRLRSKVNQRRRLEHLSPIGRRSCERPIDECTRPAFSPCFLPLAGVRTAEISSGRGFLISAEGGFRNLKCSRINRCWSLIISREFEASNESRPTQRILESRLAIAHGTPARWVFFRGKSNRNPKLDRTRHLVRAMTHAGACNELCGSCTRKQLSRGASHARGEHRLVHNPPKSDKRDWIFSSPTVGRNPP